MRNWEVWGPRIPNLGSFWDQPGHFLELLGAKGPTLGPQFIVRGSILSFSMAIVFFCILHMEMLRRSGSGPRLLPQQVHDRNELTF